MRKRSPLKKILTRLFKKILNRRIYIQYRSNFTIITSAIHVVIVRLPRARVYIIPQLIIIINPEQLILSEKHTRLFCICYRNRIVDWIPKCAIIIKISFLSFLFRIEFDQCLPRAHRLEILTIFIDITTMIIYRIEMDDDDTTTLYFLFFFKWRQFYYMYNSYKRANL